MAAELTEGKRTDLLIKEKVLLKPFQRNYQKKKSQQSINYYVQTNITEKLLPYVLSRKNFLFSASEYGSRSTCLLFSLIECARKNNINPEEYLSSIFELAADPTDWTDSKWSELLPWNIKLIKKSDVSTVLIA